MTLRRELLCDRRRLDLFLQKELPEDSRRDLEAHLDFCPACRDKLDQLAGGAQWWSEVRQYLGDDGVLRQAERTGERLASIDLSFLRPSDNPSSLGLLGSYQVLEVVGRGGWGIVLKAFDPALHRPVALKVLAPEYAAIRKARLRFAREAQAVAAVIHDHVVPVHAVDADATPPYLVMAFIPGQSLQQRIDRSAPLELKEVLRIGMQMASGLAAAHAQGLVHRDIKPANIMLENGIERVRITDFGLARAVHDASVTQSGAVTGTPQYMAPEQAEGAAVDQRADLFALGSSLYAMAAGQAPFRGESALAIMRQVCDSEPAALHSLNPTVPSWLVGIIQKLHKKAPQERFQTAAAVAELLEGCLAHVQRPDRHPLPPLADALGRPPAVRKARWLLQWWPAVAVLTVVGTVVAMVLLPLPPLAQPSVNRSPANETRAFPAPDTDTLAKEFSEGSTAMKAKLDGFQKSLSSASPGDWRGLEEGLADLTQRAEKLRQALKVVPKADPDPIDGQLKAIRHRLELLSKRADGGS
jgi:eukaryotic-like serine/threonine-protein kinase